MQNTAVYAPITFEEIVIVKIRAVIVQLQRHALVIVQLYASCQSNWTVLFIKLAPVALEWVLLQHLA